jgi:hypothetical protein
MIVLLEYSFEGKTVSFMKGASLGAMAFGVRKREVYCGDRRKKYLWHK